LALARARDEFEILKIDEIRSERSYYLLSYLIGNRP
jgi:hypothetical protein